MLTTQRASLYRRARGVWRVAHVHVCMLQKIQAPDWVDENPTIFYSIIFLCGRKNIDHSWHSASKDSDENVYEWLVNKSRTRSGGGWRQQHRDKTWGQADVAFTWHRRSVRSALGQRSAGSNPPCPLLWTWKSTAPSLPQTTQDTATVSQSERTVYDCDTDESSMFKGLQTLKTPGRFDLPSRFLFFVLPFFFSFSLWCKILRKQQEHNWSQKDSNSTQLADETATATHQ